MPSHRRNVLELVMKMTDSPNLKMEAMVAPLLLLSSHAPDQNSSDLDDVVAEDTATENKCSNATKWFRWAICLQLFSKWLIGQYE